MVRGAAVMFPVRAAVGIVVNYSLTYIRALSVSLLQLMLVV